MARTHPTWYCWTGTFSTGQSSALLIFPRCAQKTNSGTSNLIFQVRDAKIIPDCTAPKHNEGVKCMFSPCFTAWNYLFINRYFGCEKSSARCMFLHHVHRCSCAWSLLNQVANVCHISWAEPERSGWNFLFVAILCASEKMSRRWINALIILIISITTCLCSMSAEAFHGL